MDESDFEGSLVLEKLAEMNKLDDFFEAVDSDNFGNAKSIMMAAGLDSETIKIVLQKMGNASSD